MFPQRSFFRRFHFLAFFLVACAAQAPVSRIAASGCDPCDEVLRREDRGFRDDRFAETIASLQKKYPAPAREDALDPYLLLGASGAVVARNSDLGKGPSVENSEGTKVPVELFLSLRRQLRAAFAGNFLLAEAEADALAESIQVEALAAARISPEKFAGASGERFLGDSPLTNHALFAAERILGSTSLVKNFDVPLGVGYASDSPEIVFVDRHILEKGQIKGRPFPAHSLLAVRARLEKVLLDSLGLLYRHAHQLALRLERRVVKAYGLDEPAYQAWLARAREEVGKNRPLRIHPKLDMTAYFSYPAKFALLIEMDQAKKRESQP